MKDKREKLAELAHNQWSGWMEYLFSKCEPRTVLCFETIEAVDTGEMIIPKWAVDRWKRQMATDYADLSEEEKDSDRKEADKFIEVMK